MVCYQKIRSVGVKLLPLWGGGGGTELRLGDGTHADHGTQYLASWFHCCPATGWARWDGGIGLGVTCRRHHPGAAASHPLLILTTNLQALAAATGKNDAAIKKAYEESGDLGLVAVSSRGSQKTLFPLPPLTMRSVRPAALAFRFWSLPARCKSDSRSVCPFTHMCCLPPTHSHLPQVFAGFKQIAAVSGDKSQDRKKASSKQPACHACRLPGMHVPCWPVCHVCRACRGYGLGAFARCAGLPGA